MNFRKEDNTDGNKLPQKAQIGPTRGASDGLKHGHPPQLSEKPDVLYFTLKKTHLGIMTFTLFWLQWSSSALLLISLWRFQGTS